MHWAKLCKTTSIIDLSILIKWRNENRCPGKSASTSTLPACLYALELSVSVCHHLEGYQYLLQI